MRTVASLLCRFRSNPVVIVAAISAAGAGIAFLKDILQAAYLGTTLQADAFTLAYFLPDMIGNIILGTAIGSACVPLFTRAAAASGDAALSAAVRNTAIQVTLLSAGLYGAFALIAKPLSEYMAGWREPLAEATYPLLLILLPFVLLTPIGMVGGAVLQSMRRFTAVTAAPILVPLGCLVGLLAGRASGANHDAMAVAAAVGLIAGGFAMSVGMWLPLVAGKRNVLRKLEPAAGGSGLHGSHIWRVSGQYGLTIVAVQIVYFAERIIATNTETGAAAAVNYAYRLAQFPVWVYAAAFGAVILPQLAKHLATNEQRAIRATVHQALLQVMLAVVPISVLLLLFREPLTTLLFYRGSFDDRSVAMTASVLAGYALTVVSQSFAAIAIRFYVAADTLLPAAAVTFAASAVTIACDVLLVPFAGIAGLGYGAAIGGGIQTVGFSILLHRRVGLTGLGRPLLRVALANLPPGLTLWWVSGNLSLLHSDEAFRLAAALAGCAVLYGALYWGSMRLLNLSNAMTEGNGR